MMPVIPEARVLTVGGRRVAGPMPGNETGLVRLFSPLIRLVTLAPYVAVLLVIVFLWQIRSEGHLTAETGLGYALGIAGATALLLLLGYPMRKRLKIAWGLGSMKAWFRLHMFLGVLAPGLILAHSNFNLGSTNSTVALACMLIVSGSGLFGRYFYARIHQGLYGPRLTAKALHKAINTDGPGIAAMENLAPGLRKDILALAAESCRPPHSLSGAILKATSIGMRARFLRARASGYLRGAMVLQAGQQGWARRERRRRFNAGRAEITQYLATVRRIAQLRVFERLFGLWHVLHMPLFFLMLVAAIIHVIAVHAY